MQKEISQDRKLSELAFSTTEQIHKKVEKILDLLISKKVKVKTKPNKKEQHYKLKRNTREQFAKEPQTRDHSVDSGSPLANFAKQHFGVELSKMYPLMMTTKSLVGKVILSLVGKALLLEEVIANLLLNLSLIVMGWISLP